MCEARKLRARVCAGLAPEPGLSLTVTATPHRARASHCCVRCTDLGLCSLAAQRGQHHTGGAHRERDHEADHDAAVMMARPQSKLVLLVILALCTGASAIECPHNCGWRCAHLGAIRAHDATTRRRPGRTGPSAAAGRRRVCVLHCRRVVWRGVGRGAAREYAASSALQLAHHAQTLRPPALQRWLSATPGEPRALGRTWWLPVRRECCNKGSGGAACRS
jgi:hypothetical protein